MKTRPIIVCVAIALLAACSSKSPLPKQHETKLVILGVDGMDYHFTRKLIDEGRLPNLAKLAERGDFKKLATTDPPQSPVAWSTFITGLDPTGHGIYDFVHRDPETMEPYLSTSRAEEVDCIVSIGDLAIPYCSAEMKSLRQGRAFWEFLEEARVPTNVYKVPANFPPDETWQTRTLSGMGTPDILGTYGTFQLFTDDPDFVGKTPSGGMVHEISVKDGRVETLLEGPPDPNTVGEVALTEELELVVDEKRQVALVRLDDSETLLRVGEWSRWIPFAFTTRLGSDVSGMVRLHLRSTSPHVSLYVSPINLDPMDPVMPISSPEGFSADFAKEAGRYYTQGMPEDTKALSAGALSDDQFMGQEDEIFSERVRMLDAALERYEGGMLFFYFSSIDQVSHMFWHAMSAREGDELYEYRDVIPKLYERMDAVIGDVMQRLDDDTTLVVMSDHGFANYNRKVHLNTWLNQKGYLALREDGKRGKGPLGHIDWERTQAYALGLNQLFLNLKGREPDGSIPVEDRDVLIGRLERDLKRFRDPDTGRRVVSTVIKPEQGATASITPDIIVGYARGYRSSDSSAMGNVGSTTVARNEEHWNGDHCMDSTLVPGVVFATEKIAIDDPGLADFAPTILRRFGLQPSDVMEGRNLFTEKE